MVAGIMDNGTWRNGRMETTRLPGRLLRCLLTLLPLICLLGAPTSWAADSKVKFNLPSDEFPKAILEFYHQSKIEVLFLANDTLSQIKTQPVVGELEPREALDRMLKGTGLTFRFVTEHSVTIKQPEVASTPPPPPPKAPPPSVHHSAAAGPVVGHNQLDEVTITGSLIHGAADVMSPLVYITQQDLSQAPFATVQDALYQLPLVSLNAPREDLAVDNNFNWGAGINLRGLGVCATLVLVNGHRQPLSGLNGDFVDVSNIPTAAIQRIEILPDGASALYGSDAIAGVVNIILRDDFEGAETRVQYGGAPGGRDGTVVSQLLGTRWDSGKAMLVYEYSDATALAASSRGYAADADKRPYGGTDFRSFDTDPGNILNPSTLQPIYGIPAGASGIPISQSALLSTINLQNNFAQYQLFTQRTQHSVYATGSQKVGDNIEIFAEGRFAQRKTVAQSFPETDTLVVPGTNPYNPFQGSTTLVGYSFGPSLGPVTFAGQTRNYLGTVGAKFWLGAGWLATLSESYGRETLFDNEYNLYNQVALTAALANTNPATAFNAFGGATNPATLAAIRRGDLLHAVSGIETTSVVADGPLFNLPAGPAKLALGLERREESLDHTVADLADPPYGTTSARYSRHVGSAFSELSIPLLGSSENQRAAPRLELTVAGRYENYSDFGHTTNPEFRLRYVPLDSIKLRASWGRSFRAPKLDDLYDSSENASFLASFADPRSATGHSTILGLEGDNPNLKAETAKTWTAGFDVVPVFDPGLTFSLTYYSINYTGQIAQPDAADPLDILVQENQWNAVITRDPTPAQIAAVCNRPDFQGSRASCLVSSPAAIVDFRLANLASTQVSGLDLNVHQMLDSGVGRFDLGLEGSYVFHFDQAVTDSSPSVDILNSFGNPLKLRLRATTAWSQHLAEESGIGANVAVNFTNAYSNPGSTLSSRIGSLTTVDLQLHYTTPEDTRFLGGMEFALNAVNVFNQSPPFVDSIYGFDTANFQPLGRVLSLSLRKKW
jgi:iron complex outermembrane recepter protein